MSAPNIAPPGDLLASGPGWSWLAYRLAGGIDVAACYVGGRLLRRDHRGWWVAGQRGRRTVVDGDPVARLAGTAPAGWPVHPEQVELGGGRHG